MVEAVPRAGRVRRRAPGALDATTRPSSTASSSTSTPCGPSRSRSSSPHPPVVSGRRVGSARSTRSSGPTGGRRWTSPSVTWRSGSAGSARRWPTRAAADVPVTLVTFGDPDPDVLRAYRDLGIARVVIGASRTGWDDPSTSYAFIDRYAELIPEL